MDPGDGQLAVLVSYPCLDSAACASRWRRAVFLCVLSVLFSADAAADEFDTLNLTLSESISYDANIFKTPDTVAPPAGSSGKSDRINSTTLGFKINKPYAQQRLQLDFSQVQTRYDTFNFLNSEGTNYRGAWLWALTPHLTGTFSVDQNQSQISFAQFGGTQRNVRTNKNRGLSVDGWLSGGWHLIFGLTQTEARSELASLSVPSTESQRTEYGFRYEAASGNSAGFTRRETPAETTNLRLDPVNLIETNYRDVQNEIKVHWKPSGHSVFDFAVARTERINDHFSQRNYAATTGEIRYGWTPTGMLQFNLAAIRSIAPFQAVGNTVQNSTFVVDDTLSIGGNWQFTAKSSLNFSLSRKLSDYRGPVFAVTGPARSDKFRTAQAGINWNPIRNLSLSANIERDVRDTNAPGLQFNDNILSFFASATF